MADSEGLELIHVECLKMHARWIFRLYLDKESGVTLDDCTNVSNQLGDILDVHDLSRGPYTLEVSSPGLDRPISRDQDFKKYRGAIIKIKTNVKISGMKNFQGTLEEYREEDDRKIVLINVGGETYSIPKNEIDKANLVDDTAAAVK